MLCSISSLLARVILPSHDLPFVPLSNSADANTALWAVASCEKQSSWMRCTCRATTGIFQQPLVPAAYSESVKEVIQPQVPLRLPCYDFAPVTALAFGRLVPCGFRHGLRALTASMA